MSSTDRFCHLARDKSPFLRASGRAGPEPVSTWSALRTNDVDAGEDRRRMEAEGGSDSQNGADLAITHPGPDGVGDPHDNGESGAGLLTQKIRLPRGSAQKERRAHPAHR